MEAECCSMSSPSACQKQSFGKFDEFTREATEFMAKDLPIHPIRVVGCSRKTQGMGIFFNGTFDEAGKITTEVKNRYIHPFKNGGQNLVSTTGISTTGQLTQNIELYNAVGAKGVKVEGKTVLSPAGAIESAKCGAGMSMANVTGAVTAEFLKRPMVTGDLVVKMKDFLVGGQVNYCFTSKAIASYSTGIALIRPDYKVAIKADEGFKTFSASYFQSISPNLSIGYRALFNKAQGQSKSASSASPLGMEIALKYTLNSSTFLKGKLDQKGELQLAVSSVVSPGLRLVIGGAIDTKNLKASAHKSGINIVFEG